MDTKAFQERCEGVIFVEELPPLSKLRQKVAGCYDVFGICPEGEIVGLDTMGNVNCLKAEIRDGMSLCEEDGAPCRLEAQPSRILGVIQLLRDFMLSNFITKEGVLPGAGARKPQADDAPAQKQESAGAEPDYADEDLGVSHYLSDEEKAKRRQIAEKRRTRS